MTGEPRTVSRVVAGFSSFDGEYSLHARGEGERVLALESREGLRWPLWGLPAPHHATSAAVPLVGCQRWVVPTSKHTSSAKTRGFHTQLDERPETP